VKKIIGFGILFFIVAHLFGAMAFMHNGRSSGTADIAQAAWAQGYIAGKQSVAGEEGATANTVPPSPMDSHDWHGTHGEYDYNRHGMNPFAMFGMLFRCLLPLFLIGGLFMFFGKRRCRRHGHGKHGDRPSWGGHRPPWARHCGDEHEPRWMNDDEPSTNDDDDLPTADEIHEKSPEDLE